MHGSGGGAVSEWIVLWAILDGVWVVVDLGREGRVRGDYCMHCGKLLRGGKREGASGQLQEAIDHCEHCEKLGRVREAVTIC
jgi:hypothetical protein